MSGTISKNGDGTNYLTIDKSFSIDPVIYLQGALSHPLVSAHFRNPTFLLKFIEYTLHIIRKSTNTILTYSNNELQVVHIPIEFLILKESSYELITLSTLRGIYFNIYFGNVIN